MRAFLLSALALLGGCPDAGVPPSSAPPRWTAGPPAETGALRAGRWDDGQAEIAAYALRDRRYGALRDGEAILIVVKEDLDADLLVKADGPFHARTVAAMKLNHVLTVPTGVYTYRQMASVWLTRAEGRPMKAAVGSQEWCGLTNKVLTVRGEAALLRTFSYFGAEGEGAFPVALGGDTVLGDALPLWVRTLDLERAGRRTVRILDEQLSNRARAPALRAAQVTVGAPATVEVPAGSFEVVPVEVARGDDRDVFHLRREAPHTVVRWDRADGGAYRLRWVRRAAYWDMNGPEDLGALEPGPPAAPDHSDGGT